MAHTERGRMIVAAPTGATWAQVKARAIAQATKGNVHLVSSTPTRIKPGHSAWPRMTLAKTTDVWLFEVTRPVAKEAPHALRSNALPRP